MINEIYSKIKYKLKTIKQTNDEIFMNPKLINDKINIKIYRSQVFIDKIKAMNEGTQVSNGSPFMDLNKPTQICEFLNTHRLQINTYPLCTNHFVLTTNQIETQLNDLSIEDIKCCILLLSHPNVVMIFNKGVKSNFSVDHKHTQFFIPDESEHDEFYSMFIDRSNQSVISQLQNDGITDVQHFHKYNFANFCIDLKNIYFENIEDESVLSTESNKLQIKISNLIRQLKNNKGDDELDYNMVIVDKMLILIPRKVRSLEGERSMGSLEFVGQFAAKDEEEQQRLSKNPYDYLHKLTQNWKEFKINI